MDADGSGVIDLTDGSADDRNPSWFPRRPDRLLPRP
jgi:hypothetical protein